MTVYGGLLTAERRAPRLQRVQPRDDVGLVVAGAARPHLAVAQLGRERRRRPLRGVARRLHVVVGVEQQATVAGAVQRRGEQRAVAGDLDPLHRVEQRLQPSLDPLRRLLDRVERTGDRRDPADRAPLLDEALRPTPRRRRRSPRSSALHAAGDDRSAPARTGSRSAAGRRSPSPAPGPPAARRRSPGGSSRARPRSRRRRRARRRSGRGAAPRGSPARRRGRASGRSPRSGPRRASS